MSMIIAVLVELAAITVLVIGLKRRLRFISRYPELKRFYDYGLIGLSLAVLSKFVFMVLDLREQGLIELTLKEAKVINSAGNALLLLAMAMLIFGWVRLIEILIERYELIPVIEFEGEGTQEQLKPGLYLCTLQNCHQILRRLLKGRAGLIVSRSPPDVIRNTLKIEKTPVLWITKLREEKTVEPTRLEYLLQTLVDFMKKTEYPKLIFIDGIEYLTIENGFAPVFKFLTTLKDYAMLHNTVIVVTVDEKSLDKISLNLLRREFEELKVKA